MTDEREDQPGERREGEGDPSAGSYRSGGPGGRGPVWTDRVKEVLLRAARQAGRRREPLVRPEHLLLELSRTPGAAMAVLSALHVDLEALARSAEQSLPPVVAPDALAGPYPQDSHFREAIARAAAEAGQLGHEYLGTEHLLLGLLAFPGTEAGALLGALGVTLQSARAEVERAFGRGRGERSPAPVGVVPGEEALQPRAGPFEITVDGASGRPVYEQIVQQVKEGVAARRLRPGERMPTVRALAARLGVAPGTVARAYAALERDRIVVTERARGTRVARRRAMIRPPAEAAELAALLRPAVVAAFHLGATAGQLEGALREAMRGVFPPAGS